jgi:TctA family transporter
MFDAIIEGGKHLGDPAYWGVLAIGLGIATAISLVPGVGSTLMLGIALPLVLVGVEEPAIGIVLLATITGTSNTFDSIPAQLLGIVGSGTQVTFLEGHQLTQKGLGAYSLGAVYAVSAIGGIVGALLLLLLVPIIRPFILSVSFGEIAMLGFFGIVMVSILSYGAMIKGLASGFLGLLVGIVGVHGSSGAERLTFGVYELGFGLPLVATILGLMAVPEMLDLVTSRQPVAPEGSDVSTREVFRGFREGLRRWKMAIRQSLFGAAFGAIPGTGAAVVTWLSYGLGIALSKDRSEFGKGSLDGLLFAESAENAKEAGQALPTLALGIPGATSWALVLVGMMAYGITPGPNILTQHTDIVGLIIITFALANLILTVAALSVTRQVMRLTKIPYPAIGAAIIPVVVVGAFLSDLIFVTLPVLALFTAIGLIMKHYGWPRPPLVLALILAPVIEGNLFTAIAVFGPIGVITRPLTIALAVGVVVSAVFLNRKMRQTMQSVEGASSGQIDPSAHGSSVQVDGNDHTSSVQVTAELAKKSSPALPISRWRLHRPDVVAIGFLTIGVYALSEALTYPGARASTLPIVAASGLTLFSLLQLFMQLRYPERKQGEIMDIGMRTVGTEGAQVAMLKVLVTLAIYVSAIVLVGLKYAGLIFALVLPILLMQGRRRFITALVAAALVGLFTIGIADGLFHVFWPSSLLVSR